MGLGYNLCRFLVILCVWFHLDELYIMNNVKSEQKRPKILINKCKDNFWVLLRELQ